MKKGTSYSGVVGKSQYYPQQPAFRATFWGNGWGQSEDKAKSGKMEVGSSKKMMGSKQGKCAFC